MKKLIPERSAEASKIVVILAAVVIVVTGMKLAADFIVPILLAFFIATISFPITNWLREHRCPRFLAVIITVLVDFAFLTGVVLLGIVLFSELQAKWDTKYYKLTKYRIEQFTAFATETADRVGIKLDGGDEEEKSSSDATVTPPEKKDGVAVPGADTDPVIPPTEVTPESAVAGDVSQPVEPESSKDTGGTGVVLPKEIADKTSKQIADEAKQAEAEAGTGIERLKNQFLQWLSAENLLEWSKSIFLRLLSFIGTAFIVMLLTVFMLSEARMFGRRFNAICDAKGPNLQRMLSATRDIQKYLGIKTLISIATGLLAGILCWVMDLEFPLLWGILAFALNFIPAVGSVIAGIPPILLSLLNNGDIGDAMIIGGGYLLINGVLGNFLEPTLLGRRFGISTVIVILSVIFWGWLWGPIGMLMAVPLTMLLKVALDNSSDFRWMAVAISKESKLNKGEDETLIKEAIEAKVKPVVVDKEEIWTPQQDIE